MNYKKIFLAVTMALVSAMATAAKVPTGGPSDYRVRHINYSKYEVINLFVHYGYSTHVQFAPGENIENIAIGDPAAWHISPVSNHLFIKPKEKKANTNMTVITNKRTYNFDLDAHWSQHGSTSNDMMFQVAFRYPKEEAARKKAQEEARRLRDSLNSSSVTPHNLDYWVRGTAEISPDVAFDDKQFTYLTFAAGKEMPAIFVVNPDGTESLVNSNVEGNTIVIHKLAERFVLRKGNLVACVKNKAYKPGAGIDIVDGSTNPNIKRVVKGKGEE